MNPEASVTIPVVNCDVFECKACHPGVRYDFIVFAVDERAAVAEAAEHFDSVPGADRYTVIKSDARIEYALDGPPRRTPEWVVTVWAEQNERAAILSRADHIESAARAVSDALAKDQALPIDALRDALAA